MSKFIVSASSEVDAPQYLKDEAGIRKIKLANGTFHTFNAMNASAWPTESALGFDENQLRAFEAALTKEFVIIQGPPGTGKTFLGMSNNITTEFLQGTKYVF